MSASLNFAPEATGLSYYQPRDPRSSLVPILTHLFGIWHCQPPSLEISHHCLPQVVFFLASLLPPSKRKQDKERNGKEEKACQATGKYGVAGWGGAESGFEQAELEELVKVQQAAGQSRYGP